LFTEEVVRAQYASVRRPIVLPLSNPTPRAEAIPADVLAWTDGNALVGTGSPFEPVHLGDRTIRVAQANNVYVFPGLGLGCIATGARYVSDDMVTAACRAIGEVAGTTGNDELLPPITQSRDIAIAVAKAVARRAVSEGSAPAMPDEVIDARVQATHWTPSY
jgi:malate dehydrogenase (oxaloacetate-decarboxylating)